mmetsp:Transcript_14461/g.27790  ORF Transcript_14461/g.27790 Transcript_14461/m.27790 type:complete len:246 (+) Transcript_14461:277-1014(+)
MSRSNSPLYPWSEKSTEAPSSNDRLRSWDRFSTEVSDFSLGDFRDVFGPSNGAKAPSRKDGSCPPAGPSGSKPPNLPPFSPGSASSFKAALPMLSMELLGEGLLLLVEGISWGSGSSRGGGWLRRRARAKMSGLGLSSEDDGDAACALRRAAAPGRACGRGDGRSATCTWPSITACSSGVSSAPEYPRAFSKPLRPGYTSSPPAASAVNTLSVYSRPAHSRNSWTRCVTRRPSSLACSFWNLVVC